MNTLSSLSDRESTPGVDQARWLTEAARPHEPALRGYLHRQFPSVDTDDIVQESYLKLLKAKTDGKIASVKAYFFAIARNTALTIFRRNQLYAETPVNELPDWRVLDPGANGAETANLNQRYGLAIEAIDRLPPRCREIVTLVVVRGLSNAEIALQLGLSENTVRVQMARGIKKCAEFLRERGEEA